MIWIDGLKLRVSVAPAVVLTVAAYLLFGQISGADILGTLSRANPGWFAVAVLGPAVTYLAAAENLAAFVPGRLSLIRGFGVQLSTAFIGVPMPPTVGHVAVNAPAVSTRWSSAATPGASSDPLASDHNGISARA